MIDKLRELKDKDEHAPFTFMCCVAIVIVGVFIEYYIIEALINTQGHSEISKWIIGGFGLFGVFLVGSGIYTAYDILNNG